MKRNLVCLALFAGLALLAGRCAPPDQAKAGARKPSLAEKLQQTVDFTGFDDPKVTLIEALQKLAKEHGVVFDVNEKAFKFEMLNDVLRTEIANPDPIPPMKARLALVLKKIMTRIPVPTGATWLVRRDRIEITTGYFVEWEVYRECSPAFLVPDDEKPERYSGPRLPLVHPDFRKVPLSDALDALADETDFTIVLDPSVGEKMAATPVVLKGLNLPLDTAVLLLAGMADLQVVHLDNALFVTTSEKAGCAEKDARAPPLPEKRERNQRGQTPEERGKKDRPDRQESARGQERNPKEAVSTGQRASEGEAIPRSRAILLYWSSS